MPSKPDRVEASLRRPIPRVDDDVTPARGTPMPSEQELLAHAMREPMPWYIALLLRKLDVDSELRQRDQRIGAIEELVDAHEDALSTTKVRALTEESKREKWGNRLWGLAQAVLAAVIIAALLYVNSRLSCTAPPKAATTPEIRRE